MAYKGGNLSVFGINCTSLPIYVEDFFEIGYLKVKRLWTHRRFGSK